MDKLSLINDLLKLDLQDERGNGGFWNAPVKKINKETSELLDVLLKESRLTLLQKQQIRASIRSGNCHLPMPKTCKSAKFSTKSCSIDNKGLRSRQSIVKSGCYERTKYRSNHVEMKDGKVEKERLQNLMTYGQEKSPENGIIGMEMEPILLKKFEKVTESKDVIKQLNSEIEDRKLFLQKMDKHGLGKQYKSIILTEISQRQRKIDVANRAKTQIMI